MSDSHFNPDTEVFKPIPGFPGYEVSNQGRVRSFWEKYGQRFRRLCDKPHRILRQTLSVGYPRVSLRKNGEDFKFHVHRLVLLAFRGPCPLGSETCHNDGNRTNNFLANLRWDSRSNNHLDKKKHGTDSRAKVTNHQVYKIREMVVQGHYSYQAIGKMFGVSKSTVAHIVHRRCWKHLP